MTKALELLAKFPQAQVLCLGDLMLDRYIYGSADRLSPEAPVPIVRVQSRKIMPGGLGNVAKNLATLGVKVWAVGLVGDDGPAEDLRLLMKKALDPIEPIFLKDPRRPTTVKTRLIAGIQQVVRYDEESDAFLEGSLAELYQAEVARILPQVKAVALSDYGKGVLSPKIASWLISQAQSLNIPTVVDPKGADYSPYRGATVVTPNCQELSLAVGRPLKKTDPLALAQAGQELMARHDLKNLVITRSEEGMTLLTESGKIHHLPTRAQAVYDVSGAGDTVMGVLTAALACGADLLVGAVLASRAAGVVVGKVGTAVATPEEIRGSVA